MFALQQEAPSQNVFEIAPPDLAGSSSAYGDTPTLPKREDMPARPQSPYALQKLVGEQYLIEVQTIAVT